MKKIKVTVSDPEELIVLNEIMTKHSDLNFDVKSGSIMLDGKSLIGLLSLAVPEFEIHISGTHHGEINSFLKEINNFVV